MREMWNVSRPLSLLAGFYVLVLYFGSVLEGDVLSTVSIPFTGYMNYIDRIVQLKYTIIENIL